jgi:hypothetical protein
MKSGIVSVLALCVAFAGNAPASYAADARGGCPPQVATTPAPAGSQAERGPSTQKPQEEVVRSEPAETHGAGVTTGASSSGETAARECPEEHGGPRVPPTR